MHGIDADAPSNHEAVGDEAEWRDMRSFAWLTLTYHMHRLLQLATIVTWKLSKLPFWRVIDALMLADPERCPTLAEMRALVR